MAVNIASQCQRICRAYPQACALLLMRHQHTLAPPFSMIMPRKKSKRVLRWLSQAQFRMGKIRHLPSKNDWKIPHQVEIRNFPRGKFPPHNSPPPVHCTQPFAEEDMGQQLTDHCCACQTLLATGCKSSLKDEALVEVRKTPNRHQTCCYQMVAPG